MNRDQNLKEYIEPRIEELTKSNLHLEAFYLYAATIEHILQQSITYQENWIRFVLLKSRIKFEKSKTTSLENKTLGELIKIFSQYCSEGQLISELNEFNSFRKKVVHHILDNPIESLNKEARLKGATYYKLLIKLHAYNIFILEKLVKRSRRILKKTKSTVTNIRLQNPKLKPTFDDVDKKYIKI